MVFTFQYSDFQFPGQVALYRGKVRDVYHLGDQYLLMIVTDRISAFDVVLPRAIPYKGQVLNQIASRFLDATSDLVPNWKIATPDPCVTIGYKCKPFPVEMIVRAYLSGSLWRLYNSGARKICGVELPGNMKENQKLPYPVITPTTKAEGGKHDENISREEIIENGLVYANELEIIEKYSMDVFVRCSEIAARHGLILVDAKYEFGKYQDRIMLIDEINTPDSSRFFYEDEYWERTGKNLPPKQLSKEFVREWLMDHGFQGKPGQEIPGMSDDFVEQVSDRYIELYETITGEKFIRADISNVRQRIEDNCLEFLKHLNN